jgi:hypothetical protein
MVLLKSKKTPNQVDQDFVIAGKTLSQLKKDLQAEKEHYKKFGL